MFSVIFPGQGSQLVGMGKDLHAKYSLVQDLFKEADDTLGFSLSNLILNGPKEELDLTENTQPAIFLLSYSIFKLIKEEFKIDLSKAKFYAGHSLGEYSALTAAGSLSISEPKTATIPPTPFGIEFCIALPLIFNIFKVSENDNAPAAVNAEYSPKECPA